MIFVLGTGKRSPEMPIQLILTDTHGWGGNRCTVNKIKKERDIPTRNWKDIPRNANWTQTNTDTRVKKEQVQDYLNTRLHKAQSKQITISAETHVKSYKTIIRKANWTQPNTDMRIRKAQVLHGYLKTHSRSQSTW